MIEVRKHKGRSGRSVFEWRVYRTWTMPNSAKQHQNQLGKYRTQDAAEKAAQFYRDRDAALEAAEVRKLKDRVLELEVQLERMEHGTP